MMASSPPSYCGKHFVNGECFIFSSNTSFLLRNKIIAAFSNQRLLQTVEKSLMDSAIRFVLPSSFNVWSYSDIATMNKTPFTLSKQCNHFFRSERWPPTSIKRIFNDLNVNSVSTIPDLKVYLNVVDHYRSTLLN